VLKQGVKTVETDIPASLTKGATYYMQLVNVPVGENQSVDRNVVEHTSQVKEEDGTDTGTEIATRTADGIIGDSEDLVFYSLGFRVSKYATLAEKIGVDELKVTYLHNGGPAIDYPAVTIYPDEPFDGYEIESTSNTEPLIRFSAVLEQSDWYLANIFPLLYQSSFFQDAVRKNRDITLSGLPPTSPIYIVQRSFSYIMSEEDINNQNINSLAEFSQFMYVIPDVWASDYVSIRNEIARDLSDEKRTEGMLKIMNTFPWPQVSAGNYPIRIDYILPGSNNVSNSHVLNLKNTFEIQQVNLNANE
jgi:hypothetical protein